MGYELFENQALRLADKAGLVQPEFYNGTLFCDILTSDESLDLFQQLCLPYMGNTKVTKGKREHSIDFTS